MAWFHHFSARENEALLNALFRNSDLILFISLIKRKNEAIKPVCKSFGNEFQTDRIRIQLVVNSQRNLCSSQPTESLTRIFLIKHYKNTSTRLTLQIYDV